jgi:hypothetical protein
MFGFVRWIVLLKYVLAGFAMLVALQAAATQEVLKPADGEGTPGDAVNITWVMNPGLTSQVCLTNRCNLAIGRVMRFSSPAGACRCFSELLSEEPTDPADPHKSAEIRYADLAVGATQPDSIAWTVVALQPTAQSGNFRIISHVGSGTSFRMRTPGNLKLVEYGERMGLTWGGVPNADSYLVEVLLAEGARATELVRGTTFSMSLPETLRAGCETPARGVKASVRACRNGGCGDPAALDVCSTTNFSVQKAVGQGARDFVFRWSPVGRADSYLLEVCCDAAGQTEKRLIGKGTHAEDNIFELRSTGMPYVMTVAERFDTQKCTVGGGPLGLVIGAGFKASLRPCTDGVCGESKSDTSCRPLLQVPLGANVRP